MLLLNKNVVNDTLLSRVFSTQHTSLHAALT